jgi:putative redox protein
MKIKPKSVVKYRMKGDCPSHSRTDITIRDVSMIIDEPIERGGENMGLAPTEVALAALAGCTNTIGNKCADLLGLNVGRLDISIVAEFDRRGVLLQDAIDIPFPRIWLTVDVQEEISDSDLAQLSAEVAKYCPISKLFRQAGTEIIEEWRVCQPA